MTSESDLRAAHASRRRTAFSLAGVLAVLTTCLVVALPVHAAVRTATPATFAGVFASAQPGDVIELASGNYGQFNGGNKAGTVTIRPQLGADATMALQFNGSSGIRVERLTITDLGFLGNTRNITVAGSRFTGQAVIFAQDMVNANVVLDGNTHPGINVGSGGFEGRIQVNGQGAGPSGVTIQNSQIGPGGDADGIQIGALGVNVLNNEFTGIRQTASGVHTDSLQLLGGGRSVIRGNYFHNFDVAIMAPDGGDHETITDNVFHSAGEYPPGIQLGSHIGTQFVHNTLRDVNVHMDRKSENPGQPSRDGIIRDNVFVNAQVGGFTEDPSYCANCTVSYNLFDTSGEASGTSRLVGKPRFVGGAIPIIWQGWALAPGSPGKGSASDGTDRGIRLGVRPPVIPPTAGGPGGGAGSPQARRAGPKLKLRYRKRITWARLLRRGLRIRVVVEKRVRINARLTRKGRKRALTHKRRTVKKGSRTIILKPKRSKLGRRRALKLRLTISATDSAGAKTIRRTTIRVRP